MYPFTHFLVPFFLAEFLVKVGVLNHKLALLAGILGVVIDLDHYLYRIIKYGDFNLKDSWNGATVRHDPGERTFLHHRRGAIIITLILVFSAQFFWKSVLIIALSYYSHLILDNIHPKIKGWLKLKEAGYVFRIPFYEIFADVILILLVITLLF